MTDPYSLGVDVGATSVSAALARITGQGHTQVVTVRLAEDAEEMQTVAFVGDDHEILVGDAALLRGVHEPELLARLDLAEIGDDVPRLVGGVPLTSEALFAHLVAAAVETATGDRGRAPDAVTVTHPAAWGPHRLARVRSALADTGLADATLLAEPLAAAAWHDSGSPVRAGQALAVFDLGGSGLRCAVARKQPDSRFELVWSSLTQSDVGGVDFDDAVLRHVVASLPSGLPGPSSSPESADAWAALRSQCLAAKEGLSLDARVTIPARLPGHDTSLRLTRTEFEQLIEPELDRAVETLEASLDGAGTPVEAIVMVGGASRTPRVMQRLSESLDRHIAPGADTESAIARGAALAGLADVVATAQAQDAADDEPVVATPGGFVPHRMWARHAAVVSVSAAVLVAAVLLANALVGLPSIGAPRSTDPMNATPNSGQTGNDGPPSLADAAIAAFDGLINLPSQSLDVAERPQGSPGDPVADSGKARAPEGARGNGTPSPSEAPDAGPAPSQDAPAPASSGPATSAPAPNPPSPSDPAPPSSHPPTKRPPVTSPPTSGPPSSNPPVTSPPATTDPTPESPPSADPGPTPDQPPSSTPSQLPTPDPTDEPVSAVSAGGEGSSTA